MINFIFRKYVKESVDSNPHLIDLRRRMSIQKLDASNLRLRLRRSTNSYSSVNNLFERKDSELDNSSSKSIQAADVNIDSNYKQNLFPLWLESQEEFKKLRETKGNYGVNNIFEICQKRMTDRTELENNYTYEYLSNRVSYLSKHMSYDTIKQISEKITSEQYPAGATIFKKNSIGKEFYILYNGKVGLYSNKLLVKEHNYNDVFGEQIIENTPKRLFKAKAIANCEVLILNVEDYKNIITNQGVVVIQK
jgi:hypothetical protein